MYGMDDAILTGGIKALEEAGYKMGEDVIAGVLYVTEISNLSKKENSSVPPCSLHCMRDSWLSRWLRSI